MVRTSHVAKQSIKLQSVYIRNFYIKTQFSPIIILFISFIPAIVTFCYWMSTTHIIVTTIRVINLF